MMLETARGVVYPNQCDAMAHMNVQYYVAAFDQALWHLLLAIGYPPSWVRERGLGWADVRYVIEYKRELYPGDPYVVRSGITRVGSKSLTTFHEMRRSETNEIAAELEATSVYFDLAERRALPIPDELRSGAERLLVVRSTSGSEPSTIGGDGRS
jgi:acyl-CoA thioester hydrolase